MNFAEQLQILKDAQGDSALLALATVDLVHHALPATERGVIKQALLAASIPHWCDRELLSAMLAIAPREGERLLRLLDGLTVIETFSASRNEAVSVQGDARTALRDHLRKTDAAMFRSFVVRACRHLEVVDDDYARIETLFHRFSIDRPAAIEACMALEGRFEQSGSTAHRHALVLALIELIDSPATSDADAPPHTTDDEAGVAATVSPTPGRPPEFDVFLCHNSRDKIEVERIGVELRKRAILPWLDHWELPPGKPWQQALENQIETIRAAAVFVGQDGFGPWQNAELRAFLSQFQARDCPVIPVILPTVSNVPKLPPFLAGMRWVDFRESESVSLSMLVWGITGRRPADLPLLTPPARPRPPPGSAP